MNDASAVQNPEQEIRLLLIDDEKVIHKSIGTFLARMGYQVLHAYSAEEGLKTFEEEGADIVITDIKMPGMDGIELLEEMNRRSSDTEVILVTGHGDLNVAVEALRKGAFDFFRKPVKLEDLVACLQRTRRYQETRREKDRIQKRLEALLHSGGADAPEIVGESRAMKHVLDLVQKVSQAERTSVLILGDSGTGKELIARAIHDQSSRASMPFVSVNCTAIPDALLESELFGHERGAFTDARDSRKGVFELSDGGTLFLDEIGDMNLASQAKILRALEERIVRRVGGNREIPVDVRLISATNQDLQAAIEDGRFRQDLYFRLDVFTIRLPRLCDRGDDVLLLAYHFLNRFAGEMRKPVTGLDSGAQDLLRRYAFPGNVRELRNLIERAVILCESDRLTERDFASLRGQAGSPEKAGVPLSTLNLNELEELAIREALQQTEGNQTEAAKLLGIGHDALRYRIKKYDIEL